MKSYLFLLSLTILNVNLSFAQETLQTVTTAGSSTSNRIAIKNALQQTVIATPSNSSSAASYNSQYAYTTTNGATNQIGSYMLLRAQAAYWYNGSAGLGFYNQGPYSRPIMEVISGNFGDYTGHLPAHSSVRNNFIYQFIACLHNYTSSDNLITDTNSEVLYGVDRNRKFYINKGLMIGTTTNDAGSMLQVNGNITAKKLTVTETGWPDYVFDTAYSLPTLEQVKDFINNHARLPQIPSAKEITDQGLDLGEMQKLQMKKIEELTLYLIQQQDLIKEQQAELIKLRSEIEVIRKQTENNYE